MKIYVKHHDFGFWTSKPVTVQVVDWHKDEGEGYKDVLWCNHDGYFEDTFDHDIIHPDDTITTVWNTYEVCDKCNAHRLVGEEEWQDAPFEGVR